MLSAAVLPGLMDSHVHPIGASMTEFDHPIPDFESIADVLDYIRARAKVVPEKEWILMDQVFITRLKEQRYPTREELDQAAPNHPVRYRTGPDASLNSNGWRSPTQRKHRPGISRSPTAAPALPKRTRRLGNPRASSAMPRVT